MRIGLFGATGFIGRALGEALAARGETVVGFSRRPKGEGWRSSEGSLDLTGLDAVINLAGESVATRWTAARKKRIRDSRVGLTGRIGEALAALPEGGRPKVWLNASATGYYGDGGENLLTEDHGPGEDYLAGICREWEEAAQAGSALGVRVVLVRTGIVLGPGGEAWNQMARVFRLGLGGRLGNGKQWMPWIHLRDEVGAILHLLDHAEAEGAFNLVAPEPVRNATWTSALAKAVGRPAIFHAPGFALKLGLGGFGAVLLASARVVPARLEGLGYEFSFPELSSALQNLTKRLD